MCSGLGEGLKVLAVMSGKNVIFFGRLLKYNSFTFNQILYILQAVLLYIIHEGKITGTFIREAAKK